MPCWTQPRESAYGAYVAVSMLSGIRTEEARALRWSEVDLKAGTVATRTAAIALGPLFESGAKTDGGQS